MIGQGLIELKRRVTERWPYHLAGSDHRGWLLDQIAQIQREAEREEQWRGRHVPHDCSDGPDGFRGAPRHEPRGECE